MYYSCVVVSWDCLFACLFFSLQLVKLCGGMIEAGKAYNVANKLFLGSIKELAGHCHKDQLLVVTLHSLLFLSMVLPNRCMQVALEL